MSNKISFRKLGNSQLIGESAFKLGGPFTDVNHLFNLYGEDPYTTHLGVINLWNQMKWVNTPLLSQTELQKNVMFVNGMDARVTFVVPYDLEGIRVLYDPNDPTIAKLGIDGQTFRVVFSEDTFQPNDVVTYDLRNGDRLFIVSYIGQTGEGHEYEVVLGALPEEAKYKYFDRSFLKPGTPYIKSDERVGEFDQEGSSFDARTAVMKFEHRFASHRLVTHEITTYADMLDVPENPNNNLSFRTSVKNHLDPSKNNFITAFGLLDKDTGKMTPGTFKYITMVEAMILSELMKLEENALMWGTPMTVTGARNKTKALGGGLYHQMKQGYRRKITKYTKAVLVDLINYLFANRPDIKIEDRHIKIDCGQAAYRELLQILKEELRAMPVVVDNSSVGFVKKMGDNNNLVQKVSVGYQVQAAFLTGFGTVELNHNPALDSYINRSMNEPMIGQYPKFSYTAMIMDVTDSKYTNAVDFGKNVEFAEGANKNANIFLMKPKGMSAPLFSIVPGRGSKYGMYGGGNRSVVPSLNPTTQISIENASQIFLADPTRSVLIEYEG